MLLKTHEPQQAIGPKHSFAPSIFLWQRTPAKKSKTTQNKNKSDDEDGVFDLGKNRKVSVREFKGKTLIDIREFYSKDGKEMPGKKGIALSGEQWRKLLDYADEINEAVAKHWTAFILEWTASQYSVATINTLTVLFFSLSGKCFGNKIQVIG